MENNSKIAKIKQKAVADGFTEEEVNNLLNLANILVSKVVKDYMLWYIKDELCKDGDKTTEDKNTENKNTDDKKTEDSKEEVDSIDSKKDKYKDLYDSISALNALSYTGSQKIQFKNAPNFILVLQAGIFPYDKNLSINIPPHKTDKEHQDACALIFAHMDKLANMINAYYKSVFTIENKNLYLRLADAIPDTDFSSFKINPYNRAMRFSQKDNTSRSAMSIGPMLYYVDSQNKPLENQ